MCQLEKPAVPGEEISPKGRLL